MAAADRPRWPRDDFVAAVWESDLPPLQRLVALAYGDHARHRPDSFLTLDRLCERTGAKPTAARDALRGLVDAGWLVLIDPARQHHAARYQLTIPGQTSGIRTPETSGIRTPGGPRPPDSEPRPPESGPDYSTDHSTAAPRTRTREAAPVIVDPADRQPRSLGWLADEVRASAAKLDAADGEVRIALDHVLAALRELGEPDELAGPVLVELVRGKSIERLPGYTRTAVRSPDLPRWVERARSTGHRPPRESPPRVDTRPPKCGHCDQQRQVELPDGRMARCPTCHPLAREAS